MRPITLVLLMLSSAAALAQSATDADTPPRRAQALSYAACYDRKRSESRVGLPWRYLEEIQAAPVLAGKARRTQGSHSDPGRLAGLAASYRDAG